MVEPFSQKRFFKLKRYEDSLRKSIKSSNKLFQESFTQIDKTSYQFQHWQMKKKRSYLSNFNTKPILNHIDTLSTHIKKLSQLNSQIHPKEHSINRKIRVRKRLEISLGNLMIPKTHLIDHQNLSLEIKSIRFNKESRPKSVSPSRNMKNKLVSYKSSDFSTFRGKAQLTKHCPSMSVDNDICPWAMES